MVLALVVASVALVGWTTKMSKGTYKSIIYLVASDSGKVHYFPASWSGANEIANADSLAKPRFISIAREAGGAAGVFLIHADEFPAGFDTVRVFLNIYEDHFASGVDSVTFLRAGGATGAFQMTGSN
jgi:hypothetical protein